MPLLLDNNDYKRNLIGNYRCNRMRISEAESVVMELLWQRSPLGADDVVAALAAEQDWQEPTIKTLLNRLLSRRINRLTSDCKSLPSSGQLLLFRKPKPSILRRSRTRR